MAHLIEKYLSDYDYTEIHTLTIAASAKLCYEQTLQLDLSKSFIIKFLFWLRGLPFNEHTLKGFAKKMKFTLLEEKPFTEFVYGFWTRHRIEWVKDKEKFINNGNEYKTKVVWHFLFEERENNLCTIKTETRVKCLTKNAKIKFSVYWFFIKPFSGIIRKRMLKQIRLNLEQS